MKKWKPWGKTGKYVPLQFTCGIKCHYEIECRWLGGGVAGRYTAQRVFRRACHRPGAHGIIPCSRNCALCRCVLERSGRCGEVIIMNKLKKFVRLARTSE